MAPNDDKHNDPNRPFPGYPPPHLPPETYNYLMHALASLQGSAPQTYPPPYPPPAPDFSYPWPPSAAPPAPMHTTPLAGPSGSYYPVNPPVPPPHATPQPAGPSQLTTAPAVTASAAQDPDGSEDAISVTEDKRRRNTAASARFRTKKKLKALNLERSVADLTGRTEELEREAADLRRENTWLKEIVLLKGRNLAASSATSAQGNRDDDDAKNDSEPESSTKHRDKGKNKER